MRPFDPSAPGDSRSAGTTQTETKSLRNVESVHESLILIWLPMGSMYFCLETAVSVGSGVQYTP